MSKEERYCPFMRRLTRERKRASQDGLSESYRDHFGPCIGEKCMAYKNGHCMRLERQEAER